MEEGRDIYMFSIENGYIEANIFNIGREFIEIRYRYYDRNIVKYNIYNDNYDDDILEIRIDERNDMFPDYAVISSDINVLRKYLLELIS